MKVKFVFTVILSLLAAYSFAANGTMKGEGTIESPFLVDDYEDLKMIGKGAYLYSSAYELTADIDASASYGELCSEGVCNGFIPLGLEKDAAGASVFTGYFWGHGFTIRNMRIWTPCAHNVGFFANLGGLVSNLHFAFCNVHIEDIPGSRARNGTDIFRMGCIDIIQAAPHHKGIKVQI